MLEEACAKGHPLTCHFLGRALLRGDGIARDRDRGIELLDRACILEDEDACRDRDAARGQRTAPPTPRNDWD
jgi:TPR repeat protein